MDGNYMTTKEAAKLWNVSENKVRKWCREGKISVTLKPIKETNRWKIPKDAKCPE